MWVGNFDGRPMRGSSGVTGAAPLFREVMLAAMRARTPAPLVDRTGLVPVEVCALSGELAGADCPHHTREWFEPGRRPTSTCSMHVRARIDPESGLLAGPACRNVTWRAFERFPDEYASWAAGAGRSLAPVESSPRCPVPVERSPRRPAIAFPTSGSHFSLDPAVARAQQELVLTARAPVSERVDFVLDGRPLGRVRAPFTLRWRLERGEHTLVVRRRDGLASDPVRFVVE